MSTYIVFFAAVLMVANLKQTNTQETKKAGTARKHVEDVIYYITSNKGDMIQWTTDNQTILQRIDETLKTLVSTVFPTENGYRGYEINQKIDGISKYWMRIPKCTNPSLEIDILKTAGKKVTNKHLMELQSKLASCPTRPA